MEKVILGLGSNIGNRGLYLRSAIKKISLIKGINIIARSSFYETSPWGFKDQRNFINCALVCLCKLNAGELLKHLKKIEKSLGRKKRKKWAPREIDIDILFYGNHIIKNKSVIIPHPVLEKRNFVLVPLNELMPWFKHPVLRKKVSALLKKSKDSGKVSRVI